MRAAALAAALALGSAGAAWGQAPAAPLVRPEGLKAVSAHVQVIPDNSVPVVPNVGFIVGSKGVLVVDTGLGPSNGAAVAAAAQRLAPGRAIYLVATHAHPEHDLGAQAFPTGALMIRSEAQTSDAPNDLSLSKVFASRSPAMADLLKDARWRPADIAFKGDYELDLGGVTAVLLEMGPAHTAGDTAIWVPQDRVLFSGDLAMKAQPAVVSPKATLASWREDLKRLAALRPRVVVPSHGPVGDAGFIKGYRDYLDEVARRVAEAKAAGQSQEAATAAVTEAMKARYPDAGRLAGAVRMAWATGG